MLNASDDPLQRFQPGASPLQRLNNDFLEQAGIRLYIKRDDLIHPHFGGNKWRKLKYNLQYARENNNKTLLTFGGAWSNHIYATAAAGRSFDFKTIGLIRGERPGRLSPTLQFAEKNGMQLHFIDRETYRKKHQPEFLATLAQDFNRPYILPEGGSNRLALKGCAEIIDEIEKAQHRPFDIICCASGTGATLAGLISRLQPGQTAIGFSALKGGNFLIEEVKKHLPEDTPDENWSIETRFHFGGYARASEALLDFIRRFHKQHGILLDVVYTGKMFYGLWQMIKAGEFSPGSRIVVVHSGGTQGNAGFSL